MKKAIPFSLLGASLVRVRAWIVEPSPVSLDGCVMSAVSKVAFVGRKRLEKVTGATNRDFHEMPDGGGRSSCLYLENMIQLDLSKYDSSHLYPWHDIRCSIFLSPRCLRGIYRQKSLEELYRSPRLLADILQELETVADRSRLQRFERVSHSSVGYSGDESARCHGQVHCFAVQLAT